MKYILEGHWLHLYSSHGVSDQMHLIDSSGEQTVALFYHKDIRGSLICHKDFSENSFLIERELRDRSTFNPLFSLFLAYLLSPALSSLFHFVVFVRLLAGLNLKILDGFQWLNDEHDGMTEIINNN